MMICTADHNRAGISKIAAVYAGQYANPINTAITAPNSQVSRCLKYAVGTPTLRSIRR